MAKQKPLLRKKVTAPMRHKLPLAGLHKRRAAWFAVLIVGLVVIQFAYNLHGSGQPQILGYTTDISTETLLHNTNDYRQRQGLGELKLSESLSRAAQAKADNMVHNNYWSHVAPDGTTPWYYFQKAGYHYKSAGENLAYGFNNSDQIVTAWMNSQTHRQNVLGKYTDVGFGYANGSQYQHGNNTIVVAFYGEPTNETATSNPTTTVAQVPQRISGVTTIANGNAPWATYASLALIGASFLGFLVTHLETLRLGWHNARRYIVLHPALDAVVLFALAIVIVQAAGGVIG